MIIILINFPVLKNLHLLKSSHKSIFLYLKKTKNLKKMTKHKMKKHKMKYTKMTKYGIKKKYRMMKYLVTTLKV